MPREHPLENRLPPPALGLVALLLQRRLRRRPPSGARRIAGLTLGSASVLLAVAAERRMHQEHTTFDPFTPANATALVTDGAFGLTRNPMYVAMAGVLTSHALVRGRPSQLLPVAAWVGFIDRFQVRPEERALEHNFGADFGAYRHRVRRWL